MVIAHGSSAKSLRVLVSCNSTSYSRAVAGPELHPVQPREPHRRLTVLRILYLEEDPRLVAELIGALGGKSEWEVAHAKNAAEAKAIAAKQPIDVALVSATMGEMD